MSVIVILMLIILVYFFFREIKEFASNAKQYVQSLWNFGDLFAYVLCTLVIYQDIYGDTSDKSWLRTSASLGLIILWIKLFYYLRAYDQTSQLIRMIIETIKSIKNFMFILFIGIFSFSGGFYIM